MTTHGPLSHSLPSGVALPGHGAVEGPVDLHRALEEVRRLPEFQPPEPNPLLDWLKQPWLKTLGDEAGRLMDGVLKKLVVFLDHLRPREFEQLSTQIKDVATVCIGFLLILLSLYAVYLLLGAWVRFQAGRVKPAPATPRVFEEKTLVSAAHHAEQARQCAAARQYAEAVRQLYMAALCLLDEQAVVPYETARSNREYLHKLADPQRAVLAAPFENLVQAFEASRYGERPVTAEQFTRSEAAYANLQAGVCAHG